MKKNFVDPFFYIKEIQIFYEKAKFYFYFFVYYIYVLGNDMTHSVDRGCTMCVVASSAT